MENNLIEEKPTFKQFKKDLISGIKFIVWIVFVIFWVLCLPIIAYKMSGIMMYIIIGTWATGLSLLTYFSLHYDL